MKNWIAIAIAVLGFTNAFSAQTDEYKESIGVAESKAERAHSANDR